jgi:hypothetical protein
MVISPAGSRTTPLGNFPYAAANACAISCLEPLALILFVSLDDVAGAGRRWAIVLALQVAIDPVAHDADAVKMAENLNVGIDAVFLEKRGSLVGDDLDAALGLNIDDLEGATLVDLD